MEHLDRLLHQRVGEVAVPEQQRGRVRVGLEAHLVKVVHL
jgi:hypothetical protein